MTETMTATTMEELETKSAKRRTNNLVWFELPVKNLERATVFYETVFATSLRIDDRFPGLAIFPRASEDAATGALVWASEGIGKPTTDGAVVYLNCDGQLDAVLKRATMLGAKVIEEVAQLPAGMGWIAQMRDLDGNRVGLHATY